MQREEEFVLVGAPPELPDGEEGKTRRVKNSQTRKRKPNVVLTRIFEYPPEMSRAQVIAKVRSRESKRRKNQQRESEHEGGGGDVECEQEAYYVSRLYPSDRDSSSADIPRVEALFIQPEHQHTGLLTQREREGRENEERLEKVPSLHYEARWFGPDGTKSMRCLPLDDSAPSSAVVETFTEPEGPVQREHDMYHAFCQIEGKPNVYGFRDSIYGYQAEGDPWSSQELQKLRDLHAHTWEEGTFDYVLCGEGVTPAERKEELDRHGGISRRMELLRAGNTSTRGGFRTATLSRDQAAYKIRALKAQLVQYCDYPALKESHISPDRVQLYQGDPLARLVFLFKAPNTNTLNSIGEGLFHQASKNGLGVLQGTLQLKLKEKIRECYFQSYEEDIEYDTMEELVSKILPIFSARHKSGKEGGIGILYAVPFYDPSGWGKYSLDEYGCREYDDVRSTTYDADRMKTIRRNESRSWVPGAQEFPDNVLELTSFYVQKVLDVVRPIVVISLNAFLTKYLSCHMDAKMLQWGREIAVNKWFDVNFLSSHGVPKGDNHHMISYVNNETGIIVHERVGCTGIRSYHPFYANNDWEKRGPVVEKSMEMVVKQLFEELDFYSTISGKGHCLTTFFLNPTNQEAYKRKQDEKKEKEDLGIPRMLQWLSGNGVCRTIVEERQIEMLQRDYTVLFFLVLCDQHGDERVTSCACTRIYENVDGLGGTKYVKRISVGRDKFPASFLVPIYEHTLWPGRAIDALIQVRKDHWESLPKYRINTRELFEEKILGALPEDLEADEFSAELFLFCKRVIVDSTRGMGTQNIDTGIYYSSILETIERILYTEFMRAMLSGEIDPAGEEERTNKASRGGTLRNRKRLKKIPTVGKIISRVISMHKTRMQCIEEISMDDDDEGNSGWTVLEWMETLKAISEICIEELKDNLRL